MKKPRLVTGATLCVNAYMSHAMLRQHLEAAERQVIKGAKLVIRQRERVTKLERNRLRKAAGRAKQILVQFEEIQALYLADRDRLKRELSASSR